MNCKPGEICVVVRGGGILDDQLVGRIVRVTELFIGDNGNPCWRYEGRQFTLYGRFGEYQVDGIADQVLRPIRDPGEGAQDETLTWKPLPLPEIIPAMLDREVEHG